MMSRERWDGVVVGSGGAGISAVLSAAVRGSNVPVLEKAGRIGGTTALSGGGAGFPVTIINRKLPF